MIAVPSTPKLKASDLMLLWSAIQQQSSNYSDVGWYKVLDTVNYSRDVVLE